MAFVVVRAWRFAYASFLPAEFIDSVADPDLFSERIRSSMERPAFRIVATSDDGRVIGLANERRPCSLEGYDAEIGGLYVDPEYSRSGVGRQLVTASAKEFASRGCHSMAIHTLAENRIGCGFYEKLGGQAGPTTTWEGFPSKWYVWPDLTATFLPRP